MINYKTITSSDDNDLPFIKQLYLTAFPPKERRDWEQLTAMLGKVHEMTVQLILKDKQPIGFITTWMLGSWCFVEHFAISATERGKKYGE